MSADSALRANVRLLGDLLGRVLVEQDGEELLDAEERIRALARDARAGGSREALREAVSGLGLDRQAAVLRAFALFFQLANIAEQHHRIRRRREYELEGRVPRESLADAFAQLGLPASRAGSWRRRPLGRASSSSSPPIRPRRHADRPRGAPPHRGAPRAAGRRGGAAVGAAPDRGRPGGGDHAALADRRGPFQAPQGGRRDPSGALVLRAELLERDPGPRAGARGAPRRGADDAFASAAGSAATSTATRTSARTRSPTRSSVRGRSR